MKRRYPAVIVVEGQSDINFLSTFLDSEFVSTNGSDVPRETIEYLRSLSKIKPIVVLTDPDGPGTLIRHQLDQAIPNLFHAFIPKEGSIKKNKVGVAESTQTLILKALDLPIPTNQYSVGTLTMSELYTLGLAGIKEAPQKRRIIEAKFGLGFNNAKQLLYRLNNLNINYTTLEKVLSENE